MKFNCAHTEVVDIHKIQPHIRNANNHPEKQIELLAKIIDYQGQRLPIVISKRSGFIVAGHGRLEAIKKLGWEKAAVDYQDFENEAQEIAHLFADNKISELAQHDDSMMIDTLKDLDMADFDFELLGMDGFEIDKISEVKDTGEELDVSSFDNFDHQCPKCGFEFDEGGKV